MNTWAAWLALLPLGIMAWVFLSKREWKSAALLPYLPAYLPGVERAFLRTRIQFRILFGALLLGASFWILAIARPVLSHNKRQRSSEGIDISIVLDVSESMEASDLSPDRIRAAKSVIREFIKTRDQDRIALVTFGGESVTRSPLTSDHDFLLSRVDAIELRELKQGTAIGMGLLNGIARLRNSQSKTKVIVLLTDGDSNVGAVNPITAAQLARQNGIRIYSIGIGQSDRVLIPIYSYDALGRKSQLLAQVPSYLNPDLLKQVSSMTGGQTYMARDTTLLRQILFEIDRLERTVHRTQTQTLRTELFWIPAALGLLFWITTLVFLETRFFRTVYAL